MKKDWLLFIAVVLIILFGLSTLYSTVLEKESFLGGVFNRQLLFVFISLLAYFSLAYFDYRFIGNAIVLGPSTFFFFSLLAYVLFFGTEINYARRWIVAGGIHIQPSEFAKLILFISSAWVLSLRQKYAIWKLLGIAGLLVIIFSLLVFFEPDAGTTIVTIGIWAIFVFSVLPDKLFYLAIGAISLSSAMSVVFYQSSHFSMGVIAAAVSIAMCAGIIFFGNKHKIISLAAFALGIILGVGGMYIWSDILPDYQRDRIEAFVDPGGKWLNEGFQVEQSKVAIGSGKIWGKGYGLGTQSKLRFLPEHQTDFVFATFAEEFGIIGAITLLLLYAVVIARIFRASLHVDNTFGSLLCLAIGIKLLIEVFINIGMNMGVVPATGVPLPLMSSGGSMLLMTMAGLGLVQSTLIHRDEVLSTFDTH